MLKALKEAQTGTKVEKKPEQKMKMLALDGKFLDSLIEKYGKLWTSYLALQLPLIEEIQQHFDKGHCAVIEEKKMPKDESVPKHLRGRKAMVLEFYENPLSILYSCANTHDMFDGHILTLNLSSTCAPPKSGHVESYIIARLNRTVPVQSIGYSCL